MTDIRRTVARPAAGVVTAALLTGCAQLLPPPVPGDPAPRDPVAAPGPVAEYVEYMRRAADASGVVRETMRQEVESASGESPVTANLRTGLLLTSPGEPVSNLRTGREMLNRSLQENGDLDPSVRHLIAVRVAETDRRLELQVELDDLRSKIEKLMSIESSMEEGKSESGQRRRQ